MVPVFCFDSQFVPGRGRLTGAPKTGAFRLRFLYEAVVDLDVSLRKLGLPLYVKVGSPADVLEPFLTQGSTLFAEGGTASEELAVDATLQQLAQDKGATLKLSPPSTLYSFSEVANLYGLDFASMPDVFTPFRTKVEKSLVVPKPQPAPAAGSAEKDMSLPAPEPIPSLERLADAAKLEAALRDYDQRSVMQFKGGERSGLARVQYYVHDSGNVRDYFNTRNGMLGADYSTKLAPWLAHGCVSPRLVHHEIAKFERTHGASKSTYWVTFELLWRDYFRFFMAKHGTTVFREGGTKGVVPQWSSVQSTLFDKWVRGKTGMPLVDANMRELAATGFMSNRGRQNVASYLVHDLHVDWRLGAEYFESMLLDYDVHSNWGNWVSAAGLTGGRINRFNIVKQSKDYDPNGEYVRHWLPELRNVPTEYVHEPFKMPREVQEQSGCILGSDYPVPIVTPRRVSRDGGSKRRGRSRGQGMMGANVLGQYGRGTPLLGPLLGTGSQRAALSKMSAAGSALPPLLDADGAPVDASSLNGKRVALYFSAGWCPMCTSFEPSLMQFVAAAESAGKPVSLIYVASDRSKGDAMARAKAMGLMQVEYDGDARAKLKKQFGVWSGSESFEFGFTGRRSGVPALVVLSEDGAEIEFIDAERRGVKSLAKWPLDEAVWGL